MAPVPVLLMHESSLEHETGAHPERVERIEAISRELSAYEWAGYERVQSPAVERAVLEHVHPKSHVERIESLAARGGAMIDADTLVSPGSFVAALHAAGGAVSLVERVVGGDAPTGMSVHRPPGHHAEPSRAMGFCLFNNVAVAARHAVTELGLERVMIVDYDVHHGNGTQAVFADDPRVLFVSVHQSPLYPGTGRPSEVGVGAGEGYTVNLPVGPGAGDDEFVGLVDGVAVPLARAFAPQLLLISAGFDAHALDPLAECEVTDAGFAAMTRSMRVVGAELGAPVAAVLEGGYSLEALGPCVRVTMEALAGTDAGAESAVEAVSAGSAAARAGDLPGAVDARRRLARWWPALVQR